MHGLHKGNEEASKNSMCSWHLAAKEWLAILDCTAAFVLLTLHFLLYIGVISLLDPHKDTNCGQKCPKLTYPWAHIGEADK